MRKLKAIWLILTSRCWFLVTSKDGKPGSDMQYMGYYSYGMAVTTIDYLAYAIESYHEQEDAVDEVKNIINGTL